MTCFRVSNTCNHISLHVFTYNQQSRHQWGFSVAIMLTVCKFAVNAEMA